MSLRALLHPRAEDPTRNAAVLAFGNRFRLTNARWRVSLPSFMALQWLSSGSRHGHEVQEPDLSERAEQFSDVLDDVGMGSPVLVCQELADVADGPLTVDGPADEGCRFGQLQC